MTPSRIAWLVILLLAVPSATALAPEDKTQHHPEFETGEPRGMGSRLWPGSPVELPVGVVVSCGSILQDNPPDSVRFMVVRSDDRVATRFSPEASDDGGICRPGLEPTMRFDSVLHILAHPSVLGEDHVTVKIAVVVDRGRSGPEGPFAHEIQLPVAQVSVVDVAPTIRDVYIPPGTAAAIDVHLSHNVTYRATCFSVHALVDEMAFNVELPEGDCLPAWDRVGTPPGRDLVVTIHVLDAAPAGQSIDLPLEVRASSPSGCQPVESCQVYPLTLRVHTMPEPQTSATAWSSAEAKTFGWAAILSAVLSTASVLVVAYRARR